jgi:integrase/recombinase XerD
MRTTDATLPSLIQEYFTRYLREERGLSPRSILAYRDGIKLFLEFGQGQLNKAPTDFLFEDLSPDLVLTFLAHLESNRKNLIRSRNHRLAIIKSLVKYIAYRRPEFLGSAQQLLAVPRKRGDTVMLEYLTREEMDAVLNAAARRTEGGDRDYVLFSLMYNTGARVSEILSLCPHDISYDKPATVRIEGKGRKKRSVPLWPTTAKLLQKWSMGFDQNAPLFTNRLGEPLSRSGVEARLELMVKKAAERCPSLAKKNVSPHTFRHSTAMHLLEAGIDITMIAMWLGHASIKTTHLYVEASIAMKAKALESVQAPEHRGKRYKPTDSTLAFLEAL